MPSDPLCLWLRRIRAICRVGARPKCLCRALALLCAVGLPGRAAGADNQTDGSIVAMSPYEVSAETAMFEHWQKVSSAHFVVYSDADASEVIPLVRNMEMLHVAAQRLLRRRALRWAPIIYALPTRYSDWLRLESKTNVRWRVAISAPGHRVVNLTVARYPWQMMGPALLWTELGGIEVRGLNLNVPMWFRRGVGYLFETAQFAEDTVTLGGGSRRALLLSSRAWLPWARVFEVTDESEEFRDGRMIAAYDGQCALLVDFLLMNADSVWRDRLSDWMSLMQAGEKPSEAAFKRIFGADWHEWQQTMETFLHGEQFRAFTIRVPPPVLPPSPTVEKPTTREMREFFVLAQILNQDVPASTTSLDALLARGLKTASLRELLVEACLARKRFDAALSESRTAMAAGSENPSVYAQAAELVFRAAVPELKPDSRLDAEAAGEIGAWCRHALALEPSLAEANNLLACSEAIGPTVTAENIARITKCYDAVAGDAPTAEILAALALAHWRKGDATAAATLAQKIVVSPYSDAKSKALAAALKTVVENSLAAPHQR